MYKRQTLFGETYRGRALYDMVDASVRAAFSATDEAERKRGLDMLWYLWLGPGSPPVSYTHLGAARLIERATPCGADAC